MPKINTDSGKIKDDTAVIMTAKTWKEVETKMNETLHKISTWLALNMLSLNTDKTVYMEFGNQVDSTPKNLDITIQCTKINRVESTITPNLLSFINFNNHANLYI